MRGAQDGSDFPTGYLIEKSISFDNIFVIVLIFTYFSMLARYQHRVLFLVLVMTEFPNLVLPPTRFRRSSP